MIRVTGKSTDDNFHSVVRTTCMDKIDFVTPRKLARASSVAVEQSKNWDFFAAPAAVESFLCVCGVNQKAMLFLSTSSAPMAGIFFVCGRRFPSSRQMASYAFSTSSDCLLTCDIQMEVPRPSKLT
jgi:hypothetical protein